MVRLPHHPAAIGSRFFHHYRVAAGNVLTGLQMKQKTLFIVAAVALLLSFLAAAVVYKNSQREQAALQATANREAPCACTR